jgi:HPt (histidine-containing phosphotransfer) domain-containing protein
MKDQFLRKKFIFNPHIDSSFLESMYDDDFIYIEGIFKTTLDQLNPILTEIPLAFNNGDTTTLKRIVHKIKPAFGFTGFLATEAACKEFEDSCETFATSGSSESLYQPLWKLLIESRDIMVQQYEQLKEYNTKWY